MKARVKQDCKLNHVFAFSGHEYDKHTWIAVPEGREEEARNNPFLDVKEEGGSKASAKAESTSRRGRRGAPAEAPEAGQETETEESKPEGEA